MIAVVVLALLLAALALAVLLARRREPEAVARTDWHEPEDGVQPYDPRVEAFFTNCIADCGCAGAQQVLFCEFEPGCPGCNAWRQRSGLPYWHTASDGCVQPVPERR